MNKKLIKIITSITCGLGIIGTIPAIASSCGEKPVDPDKENIKFSVQQLFTGNIVIPNTEDHTRLVNNFLKINIIDDGGHSINKDNILDYLEINLISNGSEDKNFVISCKLQLVNSDDGYVFDALFTPTEDEYDWSKDFLFSNTYQLKFTDNSETISNLENIFPKFEYDATPTPPVIPTTISVKYTEISDIVGRVGGKNTSNGDIYVEVLPEDALTDVEWKVTNLPSEQEGNVRIVKYNNSYKIEWAKYTDEVAKFDFTVRATSKYKDDVFGERTFSLKIEESNKALPETVYKIKDGSLLGFTDEFLKNPNIYSDCGVMKIPSSVEEIHLDNNFKKTLPTWITTLDFSECQWFDSMENISTKLSEEFRNTSFLKIIFPFTYVPEGAFTGCENLIEFITTSPLKQIGSSAFSGCKSLKTISLDDSLTVIEGATFYNCSALKLDKLPDNLQRICGSAFLGCSSLDISLNPTEPLYIGDSAFQASGIKEITINVAADASDDDKTVSDQAFSNCYQLEKVIMNNNVTHIASSAFHNCFKLNSLTLSQNITSIDAYAFQGCTSLEDAKLETCINLNTLGQGVFKGCSSLKTITFPESLSVIDTETCESCKNLENINLSKVTKINDFAFLNCSNIKNIEISDLNEVYVKAKNLGSECSVIIRKDKSTDGNFNENSADVANFACGKIVLPENIKLNDSAFSDCYSITEITIVGGVEFGLYSFKNCKNLGLIEFKNITNIDNIKFVLEDPNNKLSNWAFENISANGQIFSSDSEGQVVVKTSQEILDFLQGADPTSNWPKGAFPLTGWEAK